jgi:two-component system OmpR family response regulator
MSAEKIKLFLVDDDALFLKSLEVGFLQHSDFSIETFATGELCLEHIKHRPDIVILDYYLNSIDKKAMNGIEILDKIKSYDPGIPVVMLSAQDRIEVAIDCMHHNATDYVVKSETAFIRLQKIVTNICSYRRMEKIVDWYMEKV